MEPAWGIACCRHVISSQTLLISISFTLNANGLQPLWTSDTQASNLANQNASAASPSAGGPQQSPQQQQGFAGSYRSQAGGSSQQPPSQQPPTSYGQQSSSAAYGGGSGELSGQHALERYASAVCASGLGLEVNWG